MTRRVRRDTFGGLAAIVSNERGCSVLLDHKADVIMSVRRELIERRKAITELLGQQGIDRITRMFYLSMEQEAMRWEYMIQAYHSIRIRKIQTMISQLIIPERSKLSDQEAEFQKSLVIAFENVLAKRTFEGERIPDSVKWKTEDDSMPEFVFFQPLMDIGEHMLSDTASSEAFRLYQGQIYFARMRHVKPLIDNS
jgi:2-iminoacetate synthase ThiH